MSENKLTVNGTTTIKRHKITYNSKEKRDCVHFKIVCYCRSLIYLSYGLQVSPIFLCFNTNQSKLL